ncbi:MAG TPA: ABC transporter permease [Methylomirabilota bacterium]|jgi:ABC-type nitrate/sulfonate/bicarbonate transport system permease component|nr:ABC transporter permease [Methylomirabilota bacterium]
MNERTGRAWRNAAPTIVAGLVIVGVWTVVARFMGNPTLLPSPLAVLATLWQLVRSGVIFVNSGTSLGRIVLSWVLAALVAIPLGIVMGRSERMDRFVRPFVELFRPISPIAWIPLAVLWFGIGLSGKVFIIFIGSFFPVLLNTIAGVKGVPPILITAGKTFGCSPLQLTMRVCIPAALPAIATGLRISFGTAWMTIISAEMVASKAGLGHMIIDGMEILRSDVVIVGMAVIGFLGFFFDTIFRGIEQWLSDR